MLRQAQHGMIELLMKLDKETLVALCVALFRIHQPHNAKKIVRAILNDLTLNPSPNLGEGLLKRDKQ